MSKWIVVLTGILVGTFAQAGAGASPGAPTAAMVLAGPYQTYAGHCTPVVVEVVVLAAPANGADAFVGQVNFQGCGLMASSAIPLTGNRHVGWTSASGLLTIGPYGDGSSVHVEWLGPHREGHGVMRDLLSPPPA